MPSGAKKRKAAKKKLEKQAHCTSNGSHTKGSDESKFQEERDSDGGEFEREGSVEGGGAKEVSLGDENVANIDGVHSDDGAAVFSNVTSKSSSSNRSNSSSSSSSSSSSGDDDVVEEEDPAETKLGKAENSVEESLEESIPMEKSVKQVLSVPEESTIVNESVPEDNLPTSEVIASDLKENLDEVVQPFDEKIEAGSVVMEFLKTKIEEKVVPIVDGSSEKTTERVGVTARIDEGSLPESSGVKATEGYCVDDSGKMQETHKYTEEHPLLSSAPVPVRWTSWMNCCGLLEVFSGGSSQ